MRQLRCKDLEARKRTVILGLVFLTCLGLAYVENTFFFRHLTNVFSNLLVAVSVIFVHNVLVVSLITLGMTFYTEFVYNFMKNRKIEYVVVQHPSLFALIFTIMIIGISILRASTLVHGQVFLNALPLIVMLSAPNGIVEGYSIFQSIEKTLQRRISKRDLAVIYSLLFVAAVIEVSLTQIIFLAVLT